MSDELQERYDKEDAELQKIVSYLQKLGITQLAEDIHYEKHARRVVEYKVAADYWSLQAQISKDREEKALEWSVSVNAALYDKAATYINVVVTLGYAGFFAIWSQVAEQFEQAENAFIGLGLAISLILFVSWTLGTSIIITQKFRQYAILVDQEFDSFDEELEAHRHIEDKINRSALRLQRYWPAVFFTVVFFAVVPGIILLSELLFKVGGIDLGLVSLIGETLEGNLYNGIAEAPQ